MNPALGGFWSDQELGFAYNTSNVSLPTQFKGAKAKLPILAQHNEQPTLDSFVPTQFYQARISTSCLPIWLA